MKSKLLCWVVSRTPNPIWTVWYNAWTKDRIELHETNLRNLISYDWLCWDGWIESMLFSCFYGLCFWVSYGQTPMPKCRFFLTDDVHGETPSPLHVHHRQNMMKRQASWTLRSSRSVVLVGDQSLVFYFLLSFLITEQYGFWFSTDFSFFFVI